MALFEFPLMRTFNLLSVRWMLTVLQALMVNFTGMCFKVYWDIVRNEVCQAVQYFFVLVAYQVGLILVIMVLVPKIPEASHVIDFRPTVLSNLFLK